GKPLRSGSGGVNSTGSCCAGSIRICEVELCTGSGVGNSNSSCGAIATRFDCALTDAGLSPNGSFNAKLDLLGPDTELSPAAKRTLLFSTECVGSPSLY